MMEREAHGRAPQTNTALKPNTAPKSNTVPKPNTALKAAIAVTLTAVTIAALSLSSMSPADAATRVAFKSAIPTWATTTNLTGSTSSSTVVEGEMFLKLRDAAGAEALATAVSDPSSSQFRQYVAPQDWIATYSPTQADFDQAVAQVKANKGITVTGTPASRLYIVFRGSVAAFNKAFNTQMGTYSVAGVTRIAPQTTPSIAGTAARSISGIALDQGRFAKPAAVTRGTSTAKSVAALTASTPKSVTVSTPCSSYITQHYARYPSTYGTTSVATANCGYTPRQIRAAYGTTPTSGAGQTVAIIDAYASPTIKSDVNSYAAYLGEPQLASGQYTDLSAASSTFTDKAACGLPSGWQNEQTLDVQAVHAVAPAAKILYVGASNCGGGMDIALSKILDQGLATIVSNSYGGVGEPTDSDSENYVEGEVNLHLQAAAEGIGLYFASGDDGDEKANTGTISPDFQASSPWVTAVGGTAIGLSKTGKRLFTVGWGDTLDPISKTGGKLKYKHALPGRQFFGGSGGGLSAIFTTPSYQDGFVTKGRRAVPDIAALADPFTGFLIGYRPITNNTTLSTGSFGFGVVGGTSLATPIAAAQMAIVQQQTGVRVGFANPSLYALKKASSTAITDVSPRGRSTALAYSSSAYSYAVTLDKDSSLKTRVGYDTVTGLGELDVDSANDFIDPAGTDY